MFNLSIPVHGPVHDCPRYLYLLASRAREVNRMALRNMYLAETARFSINGTLPV